MVVGDSAVGGSADCLEALAAEVVVAALAAAARADKLQAIRRANGFGNVIEW